MSPASNELPGFFICHTIYIFAEKDKATMSKYLSILFLCCLPTWLWAGENYRFRVYLKDKGDDGFRVEEPEAYLSGHILQCCLRQVRPLLCKANGLRLSWWKVPIVRWLNSCNSWQLLIPSSGFGKGTCGFRPRKSGKIVLCRRMNRYIMNMAIPINRSRC